MKHPIIIPALCPHPVGNPDSLSSYVCSQPIIQFKELVVDRVRYEQWKSGNKRRQAWRDELKKGKSI